MNWVIWIALGESTVSVVLLLAITLRVWPRPKVRLGGTSRGSGTGFYGEITIRPVTRELRVSKDFNPKHCDHPIREYAKRAAAQERGA